MKNYYKLYIAVHKINSEMGWEISFDNRLLRFAQKYPGVMFILIGLVIVAPLLIYDFKEEMTVSDLSESITASIIEVFFLSFFIIGYNELSNRKKDIERFKGEIDSYRPWQEP